MKKKQIAGITVLYNPDITVLQNIKCTVKQIDKLYIVDNSEIINQDLISHFMNCNNIFYISNRKNLGISKALNIGAELALKEGYNYLLTMDQDSKPEPTMVHAFINSSVFLEPSKIGILSPFHSIAVNPLPPENVKYKKVLTAWTSGCLLNLDIYRIAGPFNEDLFIDFVDHEYCLRLASMGYKIYIIYNAILKHEIGTNVTKNKLLGFTFITSNHSALRKYYITRNRLYVSKLYRKKFPVFFLIDIKSMIGDFINILLFEQNKCNKFKMILKGYIDYKRNRFGKHP